MRRWPVVRIIAGVLSVLCLSAWLSAQALDLTALPGVNFPVVGGNLANLRHSTLTKIDKSNITRLGGAWVVHVEEGKGLWMQTTPVVVDGIMYMATGHIAARDARTGELKWHARDVQAGRP